jgi:hypothetical protein
MIVPVSPGSPWGDSTMAPYPFTSSRQRVQTSRQRTRAGRHSTEG